MAAIFRKAFRDSRRTVFWLAVGFGLYGLFIMAFYPALLEQREELDRLLESYPDEMMAMFYGGDVAELDLTAPGPYLQTQFILFCVLILGVIASVQAFNALTNAERDGTLDMLLSLPVSRRRYLLGRMLSTALGVLIVLAASFGVFWLSTYIWPEFEVPIGRLALGIMGGFLPVMVVAGFAYLLASFVPSSRRYAGPLVYLFWLGSYLVYGFASAVETLNPLQPYLLFHYFNGGEVIRRGVVLSEWAVMAVMALIYFALAWWLVDRKELGV
jgi:ABC-2 type transport system permease protein